VRAPEVECIGTGKPHRAPMSSASRSPSPRRCDAATLRRCKGGQFVAHVAALPGNPYDGHTLAKVIAAITEQIGVSLTRVIADAGYRGRNAPSGAGLRVYTARQKRGVTEQIKHDLRRRSTVEPVIGHLKEDHRLGRNHLAGRHGDATNAIMAAIGRNFRRILVWIAALLCALRTLASAAPETSHNPTPAA
jgi:IS5 family transposase